MSYFLIGTFSKLDCPACRPVATVTKRENCHHGIKIKINLSFTVRQIWIQRSITYATLGMLFNFSGFPHKAIPSSKPQNMAKVIIRVLAHRQHSVSLSFFLLFIFYFFLIYFFLLLTLEP